MIRFLLIALVFALVTVPALAGAEDPPETAPETTPEQATLIHVGDEAPTFEVVTVGGGSFDLAEHRGQIVLVNFWATWCPPCIEEMPHLRDRVLPLVGDDFTMICVSREETNEKIAAFAKKKGVTELPMGGDVDRSIYRQYAEHTIPRNFVVDRDGTVIFESIGFEAPDFEQMIETIQSAIGHDAR